jgi:ubiquinone/menaquinone biosynthesis C-methylase UbiE
MADESMIKKKNNTIQFYAKISKTYDLMNYVVYSESLSRKIIELAAIKEHSTVLDRDRRRDGKVDAR